MNDKSLANNMVFECQVAAPSSGAILDKTVFSWLSRFLDVANASSMSHMLRNLIQEDQDQQEGGGEESLVLQEEDQLLTMQLPLSL